MSRRVKFGSPEHQSREVNAIDFHASDDEGKMCLWGNGVTVMRVGKGIRPFVEVVGENGCNEFGEPFVYGDYFLPATPTEARP